MREGIQHQGEAVNLSRASFSPAQARQREDMIARAKGNGLVWEGIRFASRSELQCAKALSEYCDWSPKLGVTYEVEIGQGKRVDFLVKGTFIEFHPIVLIREMGGKHYRALNKSLRQVGQDQGREIKSSLRAFLLDQYVSKRIWTMNQSSDPIVKNAELVVVTTAHSFYDSVLKEFKTKRLPRKSDFVRMFRKESSR